MAPPCAKAQVAIRRKGPPSAISMDRIIPSIKPLCTCVPLFVTMPIDHHQLQCCHEDRNYTMHAERIANFEQLRSGWCWNAEMEEKLSRGRLMSGIMDGTFYGAA